VKVAVVQPSYLPWRGYFHLIQKADVFVFYDDVQFDKHGWRNRNRIKTANGPVWLTIPVSSKGNVVNKTAINQIEIVWDSPWNVKHWATVKQAYGKAPHFAEYAPLLERFLSQRPQKLADFTVELTIALAGALGLERRFVRSSSLGVSGERMERLLATLRAVGATHYVSGPSARDYMDEAQLAAAGIGLEYMEYRYPEYRQLHPPYDPQVSVIDLLFMEGPRAAEWIWKSR
jgi:hypothetical protein